MLKYIHMKHTKKTNRKKRILASSGLALAVVAFSTGGFMARTGSYTFWKASLGAYDDSLITYTGFVTPIESVPDYVRWTTYGGSPEENTYEQVPKDILVPLPKYDLARSTIPANSSTSNAVYTVGHQASYDKGWDTTGSHAGVDIRAPKNTPVRAVANGIVEQVKEVPGGFGKYIVIRHPHVPDPANPGKTIVLHSSYAHLNTQNVIVGDIVEKGQIIGAVGKTGLSTGYQLHIQLDKDDAPFYPYWPFTGAEAAEAGTNYWSGVNQGLYKERIAENSMHPLLFIEANLSSAPIVARKETIPPTEEKPDPKTLREQRIAQRRERWKVVQNVLPLTPAITSIKTVAMATTRLESLAKIPVVGVDIQTENSHTGSDEWKTVQITLLGENDQYVSGANLIAPLYLRTAYGEAEFDPPMLEAKDFEQGTATVRMRPLDDRTVVIIVQPLGSMSTPVRFTRAE